MIFLAGTLVYLLPLVGSPVGQNKPVNLFLSVISQKLSSRYENEIDLRLNHVNFKMVKKSLTRKFSPMLDGLFATGSAFSGHALTNQPLWKGSVRKGQLLWASSIQKERDFTSPSTQKHNEICGSCIVQRAFNVSSCNP